MWKIRAAAEIQGPGTDVRANPPPKKKTPQRRKGWERRGLRREISEEEGGELALGNLRPTPFWFKTGPNYELESRLHSNGPYCINPPTLTLHTHTRISLGE